MEDSIPIIISMLLVTAFFSGVEIAFLSSNKFKIEIENKQGHIAARIVSYFIKTPSRFICTILVGINVALVVYGTYMAELLDPIIRNYLPDRFETEASILALQTFISTIIILFTAEFIPKVLFRINPNQTLNLFSFIIAFVYVLLYPVVFLILTITHWFLRIVFKIDFTEDKPIFGRVDLDNYINEISSGTNKNSEIEQEIQIFQNALDFNNLKVRQCMVPRTDIIALNIDNPIQQLQKKFAETGLSKILIYKNSPDNIIGFTHLVELFKKPHAIQEILRPIAIVPETMPGRELLTLFMQQKRSVAQVVDEHGTTSGIVTVEDVIEEIFGEIDDEHDIEDLVEGKINTDEYIFSGRLEIDYINNKYDLHIPTSGEYHTLGGFIFQHHQHIPEQNEQIIIPPFIITIQTVKGNRIEQVRLKLNRELE